MRRPGEWTRRQARASIRRTAIRFWWIHPVLAGATALVIASTLVLPLTAWWHGFVAGVVVCGVACLDYWAVVGGSPGAFWRQRGADAEVWTAERFTTRRQRRAGWQIVHGLQLGDHDIDHVAVGPGGIFAIETKWLGGIGDVSIGAAGLVDYRGRDPIAQVITSQGKVQSLMRSTSGGPPVDVSVSPLLVLWGPGTPAIDEPQFVRGVTVIVGGRREHWRTVLERSALNEPTLTATRSKLLAYAGVHRPLS